MFNSKNITNEECLRYEPQWNKLVELLEQSMNHNRKRNAFPVIRGKTSPKVGAL